MKTLVTALFFLIAGLSLHAQKAAADRFDFSQVIASLKFMERTDYPEKELGYSLRYQNDKLLKADISVYDNGLRDLKDGISSAEAKAELDAVYIGIQEMEKRGHYTDVEEVKKDVITTKPYGTQFLWSRHRLRQIGGKEVVYVGKRISDSFLLIKHGQFVKIRITTRESDLPEHEREILRFVNQVAACLE